VVEVVWRNIRWWSEVIGKPNVNEKEKKMANKLGPLAIIGAGVGVLMAARKLAQRPQPPGFEGEIVLITGGSRGLGYALVEEFARQGARIAICARHEHELKEAHKKLAPQGVELFTVQCDVTKQDEVQAMVEQVTAHYGRIDVLVNDAGIITVGPLEAQTQQDFEDAMNIMFWGAYYTTMAVLPQMKVRQNGYIVNITSIGGKVAVPHLLPYASAKFAFVGFSEGLYAELNKYGISVTTVVPGLMRTGSPINAIAKGNHQAEYTVFTIADSLPLITISANRAAKQIVKATRKKKAEITLTFAAKLLEKFHGLFPGLTSHILALVNRMLPASTSLEGLEPRSGKESQTPVAQSFLTGLSQKAADRYNEHADTQP
jgi:short-subunit dehydrogenase